MLKILELFGGIGACSKALKRLGIDYEIVDYVEIDSIVKENVTNKISMLYNDRCDGVISDNVYKELASPFEIKLKQIVEYISTHIVHTKVDFNNSTENKLFHPVNSCAISSGNKIVGEMGIMHPAISENIDKRKKFAVLELDVNALLESEKTTYKLEQTSKFQSVSVDYNFVADKNMPYATLEKDANSAHYEVGKNIREVIAFPMNSNAQDVLLGSPTEVSELQLRDIHIKIKNSYYNMLSNSC